MLIFLLCNDTNYFRSPDLMVFIGWNPIDFDGTDPINYLLDVKFCQPIQLNVRLDIILWGVWKCLFKIINIFYLLA